MPLDIGNVIRQPPVDKFDQVERIRPSVSTTTGFLAEFLEASQALPFRALVMPVQRTAGDLQCLLFEIEMATAKRRQVVYGTSVNLSGAPGVDGEAVIPRHRQDHTVVFVDIDEPRRFFNLSSQFHLPQVWHRSGPLLPPDCGFHGE